MEDTHFPSLFGQKEKREEERRIDPEAKQRCWKRRVDVTMGYYFGLLMLLSLLNIIYIYPLKEAGRKFNSTIIILM